MTNLKFRAWLIEDEIYVYPDNQASTDKTELWSIDGDGIHIEVQEEYFYEGGGEIHEGIRYVKAEAIIEQSTGLKDKHGKEIFSGDTITYVKPIRTTQTHTGDNIPNGSYTEPMEPGIKHYQGEVRFEDGCFMYCDYETIDVIPLCWVIQQWDEDSIKDAISYGNSGRWPWDDPEEGDLQYLLEENKMTTLEELIDFLSGVELTGNIHEEREYE